MKSFSLSIVAGAVALALSSCAGPVSAKDSAPTGAAPLGSISIQVGTPPSTRGLGSFDITQAQSNSDWYEVIAYNADNMYFVSSGKGIVGTNPYATPVVINNVALGAYTLVALAGRTTNEATKRVVLLGAGSTSVTVSSAGAVSAPITLTNALWHVTATNSVFGLNTAFGLGYYWESGFDKISPAPTVGTGVDSWRAINTATAQTSLLTASATTLTWYPNTFAAGVGSWSQGPGIPAGMPQSGVYRFSLVNPVLHLNDAANGRANNPLSAIIGTTWLMPNNDDGDFEALTGIKSTTTSVTFSAPAIGPSVTWGAGR